MTWLNNFRIGARLGAGFAVVVLLLCAIGGIGLRQAASMFDGTKEIGGNWLPSVQMLGTIDAMAGAARQDSLISVLSVDTVAQRARREEHMTKLNAAVNEYSKLVSSPEEQKLFESIKASWDEYLASDTQVNDLVAAGDGSIADARAIATDRLARSKRQRLHITTLWSQPRDWS